MSSDRRNSQPNHAPGRSVDSGLPLLCQILSRDEPDNGGDRGRNGRGTAIAPLHRHSGASRNPPAPPAAWRTGEVLGREARRQGLGRRRGNRWTPAFAGVTHGGDGGGRGEAGGSRSCTPGAPPSADSAEFTYGESDKVVLRRNDNPGSDLPAPPPVTATPSVRRATSGESDKVVGGRNPLATRLTSGPRRSATPSTDPGVKRASR